MDDKNKQNKIDVEDENVDSGDKGTPIVDERNEQEKELERIESIEAQNTPLEMQLRDKEAEKTEVESKSEEHSTPKPAPAETPAPDTGEHPALVAARQKAQEKGDKRSRTMRSVVMLLTLLLLIAIGAAVWFFYSQSQTSQELSQTQNDLSAKSQEVAALKASEAKLKEELKGTPEAEPKEEPAPAKKYREIPEWGVRYEVTEANKDISFALYSVRSVEDVFGAYSLELAREAGIQDETQKLNCGIGSLGIMTRMTEENYKNELSDGRTQIGKKVGEHYYTFRSPQSACIEDVSKLNKLDVVVKGIFDKLEPIPTD